MLLTMLKIGYFFVLMLVAELGWTAPQKATGQNLVDEIRVYRDRIAPAFTGKLSSRTVATFQTYWRHAGNKDFNSCMDTLAKELTAAGYSSRSDSFRLLVADTRVPGAKAWQPHAASLRLIAPLDTLLCSMAAAKMCLCPQSYSTPPAGFSGELVFVDSLAIGRGALSGKIAYTHRRPRAVYRQAILTGGAAGIVSTYLPNYNQPQSHPDLISMDALPYKATPHAFAFKLSYGGQQLLDSLLAAGPVKVLARVKTTFTAKIVREVHASIRGATRPHESIALIAHVDEPGANDNASGSATLLEIATTLHRLMTNGDLPYPARTLHFTWVEEFATVQRWQKAAPDSFKQVIAAFVLDMVGEDTQKTGGTFLIEKMPDPSAIWTRPPDQHTQWGSTRLQPKDLHGSYLNELLLTACRTVAENDNWVVRTNPFEGGSDHVPFLRQGIPAVLAWHFTDVFYHTSGDQIDKVSVAEMRRAGVSIASAALFIANCQASQAQALLNALRERGNWRLFNELNNSQNRLARPSNGATPESEQRVLKAWAKWYREAFASVSTLPVSNSGKETLQASILKYSTALDRLLERELSRMNHGREKR